MNGRPPAPDPFAAVAALPGVFEAVEAARGAVDALLRELRSPALRGRVREVGAESMRRSARASALLETRGAGGWDESAFAPPFALDPAGRTAAGALRVYAELASMVSTWERAPLQALARLHTLAAADLVDADRLGRPGGGRAGVAERLAGLAETVTAPTAAPALVPAAVVHGELLSTEPFGSADGVVARAASRLVLLGRGLDPTGTTVPEQGHLELGPDVYAAALAGYRAGTPEGVASWVSHCANAVALGARVGRRVAQAVAERPPAGSI
jgi:hypothetical protein